MDSLGQMLSLDDFLGDDLTMGAQSDLGLGLFDLEDDAFIAGVPTSPVGASADDALGFGAAMVKPEPAAPAAAAASPKAASGAPRRRSRARKPRSRAPKAGVKDEERKRRNRESAALSRKRKRAYTESLEKKVSDLTEKNRKLARVTRDLAETNERLRVQLERMEAALGIGGEADEAELAREIELELTRAGMSAADAKVLAATSAAGASAKTVDMDTSMLEVGVEAAATTGVRAPAAAAPVC